MAGIGTVMKMAFISDSHGNALALGNCMRFIRSRSIDRVFHIGDAIGYLPDALGVLSILQANDVICLKGNHEAMALGEIPRSSERDEIYLTSLTAESLGEKGLGTVKSWGAQLELEVDSIRLLLVHGSPWQPMEGYVYPDSDLGNFLTLDFDFVFMGHTHHPFVRKIQQKTIVNVGSVGLPRDVGHLSSVCILDSEDMVPRIYRVPFDVHELRGGRLNSAVHPMVWECMARSKEQFVGELINEF
jgi:putative phosphoesterase